MEKTEQVSPHKGKTGLRRIFNALFYTVDGFRAAYRHEDAVVINAIRARCVI